MELHSILHKPGVLEHVSTGRRFMYVPEHTTNVHLNHGQVVLRISAQFCELLDGVFMPSPSLHSLLPDDWYLLPYEFGAKDAFGAGGSLEQAAREGRFGIITVDAPFWAANEYLLREVSNIEIRSVVELPETDSVELHFTSPDVEPAKDGKPTPRYNAQYDADFNVVTFAQARGSVQLDSGPVS